MRTLISTAVALAFTNAAFAAQDLTDTAQVISSTPIVERVYEPRQECWQEAAPAPAQERGVAGAIVGGVAGGLLGNQVGRGSGRTAATAAGAIGGAIVGDRIQNSQTAGTQPVQRCRTVEGQRDVVRGYTVVYRYNGRDITTTLPYNPGSTVRVGVGIVDGPQAGAYPPPGAVAPYPRDVTTTNVPPPPPPGTYNYPAQYPSQQQQAPGRY